MRDVSLLVEAEPVQTDDDAKLTEVAERIRGREVAVRAGAVAYLHNGRDLIDVKRHLGHGAFIRWCEREFCGTLGWSLKSIERMIAAAELVGEKIDKMSNLGIGRSTVYRVAEKSTPDTIRRAFLAGIEAGDASAGRAALAAIREVKGDARNTDRDQAVADLAALLRKRLGSDRNRFADLVERAGLNLRALPGLIRQDKPEKAPVLKTRHEKFDRFQMEMFGPSEAVVPETEAETAVARDPAPVQ